MCAVDYSFNNRNKLCAQLPASELVIMLSCYTLTDCTRYLDLGFVEVCLCLIKSRDEPHQVPNQDSEWPDGAHALDEACIPTRQSYPASALHQ